MEWQDAIELVTPYIVKITTPRGSGTGFLLSRSDESNLLAVATAAHVIDHELDWEQPIKIEHHASGQSILLHPNQRHIAIDREADTAAVVFEITDIPFPPQTLDLFREDNYLKLGNKVGWLGFPSVASPHLCFFTGTVSSFIERSIGASNYLIDGVVISGVSGSPAFAIFAETVAIIGVVSAYLPNRSYGDSLPGLSVLSDILHLHQVTKEFQTLGQAQEGEPEVTETPISP